MSDLFKDLTVPDGFMISTHETDVGSLVSIDWPEHNLSCDNLSMRNLDQNVINEMVEALRKHVAKVAHI